MTTATTTTTAAPGKRPVVPRCGNCGAPAELVGRGLCSNCYSNATIRSQFNSVTGQRIAPPPVPIRRDDDDGIGTGEFARGRRLDNRMSHAGGGDEEARRRRDEAALIDAIERLTAAKRHIAEVDGKPAGGRTAAFRLADLGEQRGDAAVQRLVRTGKLRQLTVRCRNAEGSEPGGLAARGLRLVTAGQ
jgi:hypothetical protein